MMRLPGERRRGNAESDRRARSDSTQTREIVPSARLSFGHTGTKRKPATRAAHLKACRTRPPTPNSPHQPAPAGHPLTRSGTLKDTPRPVAAMRAAHSQPHGRGAATRTPRTPPSPARSPTTAPGPHGVAPTVSRLPRAAKTYRLSCYTPIRPVRPGRPRFAMLRSTAALLGP